MNNMHFNKYQQTQVQTASPAQLILMLYDGALKFMNIAVAAMEENNIELMNMNLVKAQRIIAELQVSLDLSQGGQIADNLNSIYDYIYRTLIDANMKSDKNKVKECLELVSELREAWTTVMKKEKEALARKVEINTNIPAGVTGDKTPPPGGSLDIAC